MNELGFVLMFLGVTMALSHLGVTYTWVEYNSFMATLGYIIVVYGLYLVMSGG